VTAHSAHDDPRSACNGAMVRNLLFVDSSGLR
jgi:hypothetical protein